MVGFKQFLIRHKFAIVLAILTSVIVALPQVYFRIDHRDDGIYQGIELLPDSPWAPRTREIQDGHNLGSIYYEDGKENPYLFQPFGSMVVGYMGKMFSLDINNTLLLSRLVLTFSVFLLIYSFVFLISRRRLVSLCVATTLLLAESILNSYGIFEIISGISPDNFLRIGRPVNPVMIYVLLFGFLSSFWVFYKKRYWQYGIISSILLGLNFYNYFYSWTYLYAFGGLLVLFLLMQKRWREVVRISSVFVGALVVAIPYGVNLYRASHFETYEEVSARFGVVLTHDPLFVGFTVLAALAVFFILFPKEDKNKYLFSLALLLTPFITMNQQILTGKILQADHYHWFFHKPIAVIFVLISIFYLLERRGFFNYRKIFAILIITVSFATGIFVQATSYLYGRDSHDGGSVATERQKYGPVVDWLNENTEKEEVVFANNETSHMVVIYTPLNLFYHRVTFISLSATKERLLDGIFSFYRLRGVNENNVREVFFNERGYVSWNIYGEKYRQELGSYAEIPDEKIEDIISSYKESLKIPTSVWLEDTWNQYNVRYLVWDKKSNPIWQLDRYSFLEEIAVFGDMVIYKFVIN